MSMILPVEGHPELHKDLNHGSVINNNDDAFKAARAAKAANLKHVEMESNIQDILTRLKSIEDKLRLL